MTAGRLVLLASLVLASGPGCGSTAPSAYVAGPVTGPLRVAVIPLMNYTSTRDAATQLLPLVSTELSRKEGVTVVDMGRVEDALNDEPWIMTDRIPPDLVDSLGVELGVDAVLVGSVLEYGFRDGEGWRVPQVSLSLRLLAAPGGRVLWSVVHSRDGSDRESLFGMGRTESLQILATRLVREVMDAFPSPGFQDTNDIPLTQKGKELP